jgi:hypothetical protein
MLSEKMPNWKIGLNIDRYIRYGYLGQDDNGQMYLDWRTRAEVDQRALINMLLSSNTQKQETSEPREEPEEENK